MSTSSLLYFLFSAVRSTFSRHHIPCYSYSCRKLKSPMNLAFVPPFSIFRPRSRAYPTSPSHAPPIHSPLVFPRMVLDPNTVGTGYAFLDGLKGVVIGPTINEITAAFAGGTVGVMGTIITLEVRRQRVKERKQCPYCRGTGKLPCATCYTLRAVPCADTVTAQQGCTTCQERGYLQCNHVSIFFFFPYRSVCAQPAQKLLTSVLLNFIRQHVPLPLRYRSVKGTAVLFRSYTNVRSAPNMKITSTPPSTITTKTVHRTFRRLVTFKQTRAVTERNCS